MNNPVKLLFGSLVGAGIGVALSKVVERQQEPGLSTSMMMTGGDAGRRVSAGDESLESSGQFKDRLARARAAGIEAKLRKEAELRELFRAKVHRPDALTSPPAES